jgi:hypothetical protein
MAEQGIDRLLVARHYIEHAIRQAGLAEQLGHAQRGGRHFLRRLENEAIAAGDGDRKHPQRHHRRKIERRDAGADAERLQQRVAVDAAADILGVLAFEQVRGAARELDDFDAALQGTGGIQQGFAMLLADEAHQFGLIGFHQLAVARQNAGTLERWRVAPAGERRLGGGHGLVDIGLVGQGRPADDFAGGRVEDVGAAGTAGWGGFAIDPQRQRGHGQRLAGLRHDFLRRCGLGTRYEC